MKMMHRRMAREMLEKALEYLTRDIKQLKRILENTIQKITPIELVDWKQKAYRLQCVSHDMYADIDAYTLESVAAHVNIILNHCEDFGEMLCEVDALIDGSRESR